MNIYIDRYNPDTDKKWTETFSVDEADVARKTVMDLLNDLVKKQDSSLAYYSHSVCNHGICGRCVLSVNGKNRLACTTPLRDLDEIHLGPARAREVVRDLVTK